MYSVRIEYEQKRAGYRRKGHEAHRGEAEYPVKTAAVGATSQRFAQVVEIPEGARNVQFYLAQTELPPKHRHALQQVR